MIPIITQPNNSQLLDVLAEAFTDNKSVNYAIKQDSKRVKRIHFLIQYALNICLEFGEVWQSDDRKGYALMLFPDQKRITFRSILWDIQLATLATGLTKVPKVLDREARIRSKHPATPFCHLWFLGVAEKSQGQGIGSALLTELIEHCQSLQRPIYLETSTLQNLPWYEKFGFQVYDQLDFGFSLYMLRKTS